MLVTTTTSSKKGNDVEESWRREKIGNRNVFVFDEAFLSVTSPSLGSLLRKLLSFFWFLTVLLFGNH